MTVAIDAKIKRSGKWSDMPAEEFRQDTLFAFLARWDGEEMRLRVEHSGRTDYVAGNDQVAEQLRRRLMGRGRVLTIPEFYREAKRIGLLGVMLAPIPECFPALFPCAAVEQINLF